MEDRKKTNIFLSFLMIANIVIISIGTTFAYFGATTTSEEGVLSFESAVFNLDLEEDTSLIKTQVIPSKELYIDYSTLQRLDENNNFIKPYEENGKLITKETVCIDDNLNEICSIYTFTVINPMTEMALPLYVTINPSVNTFSNLYFKVLDEDKNIIMEKTPMKQENQTKDDIPIALSNIKTIPKATVDSETGEVVPSRATYSIVMWVLETEKNQTEEDSGKLFAATLNVMTSEANGGGIIGVFTVGGSE